MVDPTSKRQPTLADRLVGLARAVGRLNTRVDTLEASPSSSAWGGITGTLADQTDLQAALDGKQASGSYAASAHGHVIADVTGLQTALDGKQAAGSYQPLATVLTNTTAAFTTAQETKLSGVATGATANSSDATLLDRANHTGSQAAGTITGLATVATSGNASDLNEIGASSVLGNPDGATNLVAEIPFADFGNLIPTFTDLDNGTVPASGGGDTFLRADGIWSNPSPLNGLATVTIPNARLDWEETITATGVTPSSRVFLCLAPASDDDENDPTMLSLLGLAASPGTDEITVAMGFGVLTQGPINLNWSAL